MTTVVITETISEPVGCWTVSETDLIWRQIECQAPAVFQLLCSFV